MHLPTGHFRSILGQPVANHRIASGSVLSTVGRDAAISARSAKPTRGQPQRRSMLGSLFCLLEGKNGEYDRILAIELILVNVVESSFALQI